MTEPSRRSPRSRGFSLAEVLVALALLSVIILALFGLVTAGVQRAYGGKKMTEGTVLAQAVMERANVEAPQDLLSAASTDTAATRTWTMTAGVVSPAAEGGSSVPINERNAWRTMFATSGLPGYGGSPARPARLIVTMTALPTGASPAKTFADAAAVRIVVDVEWWEYRTRKRTVRLQTLNVRSANL